MEAELKCLRAVGTMEERLRNACNVPNATFDSLIKVRWLLVLSSCLNLTGFLEHRDLALSF